MAVLNEPMSWDSEEPGLSLQRGDGERKGDFHSGVSSVHIFILPIYSILTRPRIVKYSHFMNVDSEA